MRLAREARERDELMAEQSAIDNGDRDRLSEFASTRDPRLRDEIVASHLGLAHQMARRFANRGEPHDDLVQVASMALVKALDRFDPERGVRFSTFAVKCMLGELKRHFRDRGWAVKAPRRVQELYLELGHDIDRLVQEYGRAPTVAELAAATGATEPDVLEALEAGRGYRSSSLDVPDQEGQPLVESIGSIDEDLASVEDKSVLLSALSELPEREQVILRMRFVDGLTQSDIAARFGVSQMQISRLLAGSIQRLRLSFVDETTSSK
jgi:RNA polymerase sigma-B factor